MADTKYSRLETSLSDKEDLGYIPLVKRRRCPNFFASVSFAVALAFFAGILATFGSIRIHENVGKRGTDWLSKLSQFSMRVL